MLCAPCFDRFLVWISFGPGSVPDQHTYFCPTCQVDFANVEFEEGDVLAILDPSY